MTISPRSPQRSKLAVPAILLIAFVVAVALILTGRSAESPSAGSTTIGSSTSTSLSNDAAKPLGWLGEFTSEDEVRVAVNALDVRTLTLPPAPSGTGATTATPAGVVAVTEDDAARCDRGITKTSTDPLGEQLAALGGSLAAQPILITSYTVTAGQDRPAGVRVFVVDVVSCRVLTAIDYPGR